MKVGYVIIGTVLWLWSLLFALYHWGVLGLAVVFIVPPLITIMPLVGLFYGVWFPVVLEIVGLVLLYLSSRNKSAHDDGF